MASTAQLTPMMAQYRRIKSELPKERYIELLRDLKANGHRPILYFWGGEPMLYGGLMDIIEEGARLGMPPTLGTNGTLLLTDTNAAHFPRRFYRAYWPLP